jgi:hypothetical protein
MTDDPTPRYSHCPLRNRVFHIKDDVIRLFTPGKSSASPYTSIAAVSGPWVVGIQCEYDNKYTFIARHDHIASSSSSSKHWFSLDRNAHIVIQTGKTQQTVDFPITYHHLMKTTPTVVPVALRHVDGSIYAFMVSMDASRGHATGIQYDDQDKAIAIMIHYTAPISPPGILSVACTSCSKDIESVMDLWRCSANHEHCTNCMVMGI